MSNFEEQMRLFEAEVGQGLRPPHPPPPKPAFMPASVRTQQVGGPPPPSFARSTPGLVKSFTPVQKQYSAPAVISKPSEEEDVFSTLLKYEKEVRAEKREKKQIEKEKKKVKKDKKDSSKAIVAAAPPQPALFKPSHISAQPTAAPVIKPGTQVTPDEIKLKAKQMVELVKATQVIQTKRLPPTQNNSKPTETRDHSYKTKKPKKMIRVAGGQVWEDQSLLNWDINDFRLFCGDLGNDVTDEVLTRTFSRYPSFQMAKVVRDKRSNKTKGYGFVSFKDPMDFTKAIKEMDGKYVGSRPIKLRKSNWKDRNVDIVKGKQKLKQQMGYKY